MLRALVSFTVGLPNLCGHVEHGNIKVPVCMCEGMSAHLKSWKSWWLFLLVWTVDGGVRRSGVTEFNYINMRTLSTINNQHWSVSCCHLWNIEGLFLWLSLDWDRCKTGELIENNTCSTGLKYGLECGCPLCHLLHLSSSFPFSSVWRDTCQSEGICWSSCWKQVWVLEGCEEHWVVQIY